MRRPWVARRLAADGAHVLLTVAATRAAHGSIGAEGADAGSLQADLSSLADATLRAVLAGHTVDG